MNFLPQTIEDYVIQHTEREPELLYQLNRETHQKVLQPRMLAGHIQGRVISMLSHMIKPKQVLEIGTYTGYSAICWAEGLQKAGKIHTIDVNEELEDMVKYYIGKANCENKIKTYIGNALEVIPTINEDFDLVFIDADKHNYINYYDLVFEKLNPGGYIIADNVLWSGKVVEELDPNDIDTKALIEFNQKIQNDSRVQNVLFPIRDGLMVIRKL